MKKTFSVDTNKSLNTAYYRTVLPIYSVIKELNFTREPCLSRSVAEVTELRHRPKITIFETR